MRIEVLGVGCAKCEKLEENAKQAVKEAGVDAEVVHIRDLNEIMKRGVLMTPALIIDGKVVAAGKVPTVEKIKEILLKR
ncbi:MAG: thioredoxin family protein [Planctomycetota bacterium]|nr:thioredoxin family protein [Planctomycetota bacterium]